MRDTAQLVVADARLLATVCSGVSKMKRMLLVGHDLNQLI